jgi:uncharacterized protein YuzE
MEIKYFQDTDTLLLNFNNNEIHDTKDFDENILVEVDKDGNLVSMTIEHAKEKANMDNFSFQQFELTY